MTNNWKETMLGDVLKIDELTIDNNYPFNEIEYIDIASVEERQILQTQKLMLQEAPSRAKMIVRDNDILISTVRPNLKHYCFIKKAAENLVASTGFAVITAKKANPAYLYYLLTTNEYTAYLTQIAEGHTSAYPSFNPEIIENSVFVIPPLPEQKAVAAILSSFDDKIELLRRQNKTLESIAQTIFKEWFVNFKIKNQKLKIKNDSGLPEGWRMGKLTEMFDFMEGPGIRNWQYTESGRRFMNIRLIQDGDIDIKKANFVSLEEAETIYKHFHLQEKDMVVSTSGTLGRSAIVRKEHLPIILNTSVIRFRPIDELSYGFMYQFLNSPFFQNELESLASGSVQLNFGPVHLKQIEMVIPPDEILKTFAKVVNPLYEKLISNFSKIQTLSKLRDTLLPKLMKGEIRVKGDLCIKA